ncbi:MAG: DnaJ domain-containing protein [Clostridia bacterium]
MNPYKVLGVSENASQEEIRRSYLELVKKYHPDRYTDNPLKDLANEKLKEINEAYDLVTKKQTSNSARARDDWSYDSYSGTGGSYSGPDASEFSRVRQMINQNNLDAAKQLLDGINTRNAEWYYLYGIIYLRQGWYDKAREYMRMAYEQEPQNAEYKNAYTTLNNSGNPYASYRGGTYNSARGETGTSNSSCSGCDMCSSLLCADCCCECMGGDLVRCC